MASSNLYEEFRPRRRRATSTEGQRKYKIYLDPEADDEFETGNYIEHNELIKKIESLYDANETIVKVKAYTFPNTGLTLPHMVIVFQTSEFHWSIEKKDDGLTIQRSRNLSAVKDRYRRENRSPEIYLVKTDGGNLSVNDLIHWLNEDKELNNPHDRLASNYNDFAKRVFDQVSEKEKFTVH